MRPLVLFAVAVSVVACGSGDDGGSSGGYTGTSGAGASGSSSGGSQCDQPCVDEMVAYAIDNTGHLLYNQNAAGQPSPYDKMAPCPGGGTAHVTGTASSSTTANGDVITSVDLTFDLVDCKASKETYALTFQGSLAIYGTFTADQANNLTFSSQALSVDGTILVLDQPAVMFTCPISLADTYHYQSDEVGWLNGSVCDRPVSL